MLPIFENDEIQAFHVHRNSLAYNINVYCKKMPFLDIEMEILKKS